MDLATKDRLIFAADYADWHTAGKAIFDLQKLYGMAKVGLALWCEDSRVRAHMHRDIPLFLDLKFYDIPQTVRNAVAKSMRAHPRFLTIHWGCGEMVRAACESARNVPPSIAPAKVLVVTKLTSEESTPGMVAGIASAARAFGADGVVCGVPDVSAVRDCCGPDFIVVTPGIRMPGQAAGDQHRIGTPRQAIEAGADFIVVGRAITQAADPAQAMKDIVQDMET